MVRAESAAGSSDRRGSEQRRRNLSLGTLLLVRPSPAVLIERMSTVRHHIRWACRSEEMAGEVRLRTLRRGATEAMIERATLTPTEWARLRVKTSMGSAGEPCPFCHELVKYGDRYHGDTRGRRAHVRCVAEALKVPVTR